jgi:bifunctional polynucleotide phosphatase/kinase
MVIYNLHNAIYKKKMAGFDYDWTLVKPKGERTFPKDINDWELLYDNVPNFIKECYEKNCMVVIFTNQTKSWKCEQIKLVLEPLQIPMFIVTSLDKKEHKPNLYMFHEFIKDNTIDKQNSFYIGDALGRKGDWSDSDKVFAQNIGITYFSPETIFHIKEEITIPDIILSSDFEIIIMMGYPGSGKTTIAENIKKQNEKYTIVSGDLFNNPLKMIKYAKQFINEKSIIFDATNSSKKKRNNYIEFAKQYNYSVKCIHVSTSLDISYKRNKCREDKKQVPRIAYNVYKKHFEIPDESEGFILLNL